MHSFSAHVAAGSVASDVDRRGWRCSSSMVIEQLISHVFAATAIWDAKETKHSDRQYIAKEWEGIAAKLGVFRNDEIIVNV